MKKSELRQRTIQNQDTETANFYPLFFKQANQSVAIGLHHRVAINGCLRVG